MRMSQFLFRSLRSSPIEAESEGHALLLRGGYVLPVGAGLITLTPLGLRVLRRIARVMQAEMDALGLLEVNMPLVQPADLWRESKRWDEVGVEMARFTDRTGRELCLATTHEEAATNLARSMVDSWRQLPLAVYQIQTKFRDEPRPRNGLLRVREFMMKDAYSFHATAEDLDEFYARMHQAYLRIFARIGLEVSVVEGHAGMMGGHRAHEFAVITPVGEDTVLLCDSCGQHVNSQVARSRKPAQPQAESAPMRELRTPGTTSIRDLTELLNVPASMTAKALIFTTQPLDSPGELVFAVVRGDTELNERKLAAVVGTNRLRPATEDEIRACGAEPGYASPLAIRREGVRVVVDELVDAAPGLVAGANRVGFHVTGVRHGRDFVADVVADIALAAAGDGCINCGAALRAEKAVEVGNIFQLGTRYSEAMKAGFRDADGEWKPFVMGSYGIGPGRVMASLAETHRDGAGPVWPAAVAPFDAVITSLDRDGTGEVAAAAAQLYERLRAADFDVLLDDREERAGVKFADADLIGAPVRITVGSKGLTDGLIELKVRASGAVHQVGLEDIEAISRFVSPS